MTSLSDIEHDALTEIFNIGVGAAADVLSQMIHEPIYLSVPLLALINQHLANQHYIECAPRPLCAIRQTYTGEVTTEAILMFPEEKSLELVRLMVGTDMSMNQLTEMGQDAMAEIGNIILNSVVSSLSSCLRLSFAGDLPTVNIITDEKIFLSQDNQEQAPVIALTIDFSLHARKIHGQLAFFLDFRSSELLIDRLKIFIGNTSA